MGQRSSEARGNLSIEHAALAWNGTECNAEQGRETNTSPPCAVLHILHCSIWPCVREKDGVTAQHSGLPLYAQHPQPRHPPTGGQSAKGALDTPARGSLDTPRSRCAGDSPLEVRWRPSARGALETPRSRCATPSCHRPPPPRSATLPRERNEPLPLHRISSAPQSTGIPPP